MIKMREQFEKWALSEGLDILKDESGAYFDDYTEGYWTAWKASRENLVIELPIAPSVAMYVTVDEAVAARKAHFRVVDAIKEQGVKYE